MINDTVSMSFKIKFENCETKKLKCWIIQRNKIADEKLIRCAQRTANGRVMR